jgi:hypothetical protein
MKTLYVVTVISNPLLWKSRILLAEKAIESWLEEPNVKITVVECVYGNRDYQLDYLSADDKIKHVPVRAKTLLWIKENLLNIGLQHLSHDAKYIVALDADILYRRSGWAKDIINELEIYPVIQPWSHCYDLGPNGEHIAVHQSFGNLHAQNRPVVPRFDDKTLHLTNQPYSYPHPGYGLAAKKEFLDWTGGFFEYGGVGAGDHHQLLSLIGSAHMSMPKGINGNFKALLMAWQARALAFNGFKLGYLPHTIEHMWHGKKGNRAYNDRWFIFLNHQFDPITDIKKNSYGVLEFAGNKPTLEREWEKYLRARNEDDNSV